MFGEMLDVALRQFDFRDFAALCAGAAIDRVVDFFRSFMKLTFHKRVRLQPAAEAQVFLALLVAFALNLD